MGKTLKDGLIDTATDRFDWKYRHTVDQEVREVRVTEDVTKLLVSTDDKNVIKKLYSGQWNDVVTNIKPMPDGRGILEIYKEKGKIEYKIGTFKNGKMNGYILEFKSKLDYSTKDDATDRKVEKMSYCWYQDDVKDDKVSKEI